jgi:tRNA A37 threonylcarbamoyladenosine biosynthesis protein TsaE
MLSFLKTEQALPAYNWVSKYQTMQNVHIRQFRIIHPEFYTDIPNDRHFHADILHFITWQMSCSSPNNEHSLSTKSSESRSGYSCFSEDGRGGERR